MGTIDRGYYAAGIAGHDGCVAVKVDVDLDGPAGVLDIVAIVGRILVLGDILGGFGQFAIIQRDFLGGDFLFLTTAQDDFDHYVHIADADFAVAVHVGSRAGLA